MHVQLHPLVPLEAPPLDPDVGVTGCLAAADERARNCSEVLSDMTPASEMLPRGSEVLCCKPHQGW